LKDLSSGKSTEVKIGKGNMVVVKVPANTAHAIINNGKEELVVLGYITEPFNPDDPDTHPYEL
jgi:mannose-6-phosphate isomerase-like protein (cupin superfamily)